MSATTPTKFLCPACLKYASRRTNTLCPNCRTIAIRLAARSPHRARPKGNIDPVWTPLGTWAEEAACAEADASLFDSADGETARFYCRSCPVANQCLTYALMNEEGSRHGVWGGMTARERRNYVKRLNELMEEESQAAAAQPRALKAS